VPSKRAASSARRVRITLVERTRNYPFWDVSKHCPPQHTRISKWSACVTGESFPELTKVCKGSQNRPSSLSRAYSRDDDDSRARGFSTGAISRLSRVASHRCALPGGGARVLLSVLGIRWRSIGCSLAAMFPDASGVADGGFS
jgi:hypothetical protein